MTLHDLQIIPSKSSFSVFLSSLNDIANLLIINNISSFFPSQKSSNEFLSDIYGKAYLASVIYIIVSKRYPNRYNQNQIILIKRPCVL